jgi:methyltransferase (TIGR00027 family)
MNARSPSRTALAAALIRARHTRLDPQPLIDDAWGERLVPTSFRVKLRESALAGMAGVERARALASPETIVDDHLRRLSAYANVVLRSRYTEDALQRAISNGVRQYVMIGAGFDSFSLRRPPFAQGVCVYEIDHPATQAFKLERLAACGAPHPASTHFVAADLGIEDLGTALSRSPFRFDQPAFFSWLGVTMYLTQDANRTALRSIVRCAAPGSELVFTYIEQGALERGRPSRAFQGLQRKVASLGEPFLSGFDPPALAGELRQIGLSFIEDLNGQALAARYDSDGTTGLCGTAASHIAWMRVASAAGPDARGAAR